MGKSFTVLWLAVLALSFAATTGCKKGGTTEVREPTAAPVAAGPGTEGRVTADVRAQAVTPAEPSAPAEPVTAGRPTGIPGTGITFEGGDGSSMQEAIVIVGAKGEVDGVDSEYQYLEMAFGQQDVAWTMTMQSLLDQNGKKYDQLDIVRNGKSESYYFDITGFFGKF